jgi:hypothetical protein
MVNKIGLTLKKDINPKYLIIRKFPKRNNPKMEIILLKGIIPT